MKDYPLSNGFVAKFKYGPVLPVAVCCGCRGLLRINEVTVVCAEWMPGGDLTRLMASQEPMIFYLLLIESLPAWTGYIRNTK